MRKELGKEFILIFLRIFNVVALPASRYITPVTKIALIWRWHTPNAPINAADPNIMRQTKAHEIDRFCIPCYNENFPKRDTLIIENLTFWATSYEWYIHYSYYSIMINFSDCHALKN